MSPRSILIACFVALTLGAPVSSAHESEPVYDQISFNVSADQEVDNDTLVAVLYVEHEGNQQAALANKVNEAMNWALGVAKAANEVKTQTMQYSTYPVYKNRRIAGWRARQSLRLESGNPSTLSELVASLQERLSVQSLNYQVSSDARRDAEDELLGTALERFSERAQSIASNLQRSGYRIVNLHISGGGGHAPRPMAYAARSMDAAAEVAPAAIEAGVQKVSITVSGTIELSVN